MTCTAISEADSEIGVSLYHSCLLSPFWKSPTDYSCVRSTGSYISCALDYSKNAWKPIFSGHLTARNPISPRCNWGAARYQHTSISETQKRCCPLYATSHRNPESLFAWQRMVFYAVGRTGLHHHAVLEYSFKSYHEIANTFDDEIKSGIREATVDPTSKEAVRFARKQSLICQVLMSCSDAQTMTGICLTRNDAGWAFCWCYALLLQGIALTIAAIAQAATLSMYHLHMWVIWSRFRIFDLAC